MESVRNHRKTRLVACLLALGMLVSCSPTRVLSEGDYFLSKNKVVVENSKHFNTRELVPYIKQKENASLFGWKPFLLLYNTQNGKGKGWDKFVRKLGDPPVIFDEASVRISQENIRSHLEYIGYYGSEVQSDVVTKGKEVTVTYKVNLGKRVAIDSIEFELPRDSAFRACFYADTAHFTLRKGDWLSEKNIDVEASRGSNYLRNNGYYGFNKTDFVYEADTLTLPGKAILTLRLNQLPPKRHFGEVSIDYPASLPFREKVLRGLNTIKPGDLYSENTVNNTYTRLSQLQLFNAVNIQTSVGEDQRVRSAIVLSQAKLQGFKVDLQASTNANWLFGISPQLSYFHKNVFGGGEILNVSIRTNHQFSFNSRITGDKKSISANEVGLSAGLRIPKFVFLPYESFPGRMPQTELNVSFTYQERPEYKRYVFSGNFGYVGSFNNLLSYQFNPLQLGLIRVPYQDDNFYNSLVTNPFLLQSFIEHFDWGLGGTLLYKTSPEANPTTTYFYTRLQFDTAGNLFSLFKAEKIFGIPYNQYVRGELTLGQVVRFGKDDKHSFAFRFLLGAGVGYGNSISLPYEKLFYAGGASSMRGWQARTLGPGNSKLYDYFVIPSQTAGAKFEMNVEYRFPLFWKLEGAAFVDVGNIYDIVTDRLLSDLYFYEGTFSFDHMESLAANWGLGLRVNLDFLVLRLDAGFRIHDPARDAGMRWLKFKEMFSNEGCAVHFGVGYPF